MAFKLICSSLLSWSECSRNCGGGIRQSRRNCSDPKPDGGGLYCIGSRVRYESCNTWECPRGSQDPRLHQCQKFNGNNFKINGIPKDVKWVPKYTASTWITNLLCSIPQLQNINSNISVIIHFSQSNYYYFSSCLRSLQIILPSSRFFCLLFTWGIRSRWHTLRSRYVWLMC